MNAGQNTSVSKAKQPASLASKLLLWYDENGRRLPFRGTHDPYRVWLSEIMLQQTRTETVGAYYERFLLRFPDVRALALASEEEVLKAWEGLGYYSRARNLQKAAKIIVSDYDGHFPESFELLKKLPGIGDYTAAAIASISFDLPFPAMDGNLTRVFARLYGIHDNVAVPSVRRALYQSACSAMPAARCGDFNQALMDIGATVCTPGTPNCEICPLSPFCKAYDENDADELPVLPVKTPPKQVDLNVLLLLYQGKIFLKKREESLLNGMYVFFLTEEEPFTALTNNGIRAAFITDFGFSKHVFTHRIWNMRVAVFQAFSIPEKLCSSFYSLNELNVLPLPTAMRYARACVNRAFEYDLLPTKNAVSVIHSDQIDEAGSVYAASWRDLHQSIVSSAALQKHSGQYHAELLRQRIRAGNTVCLSTENRGVVTGVLCLDTEHGEIMQLYVAPEYQHKGIGTTLLSYALYRLNHFKTVFLTVLEQNKRAIAFYEKMGFRFTGKKTMLNEKTNLYEIEMARETV